MSNEPAYHLTHVEVKNGDKVVFRLKFKVPLVLSVGETLKVSFTPDGKCDLDAGTFEKELTVRIEET
jgi:hypothetical protein